VEPRYLAAMGQLGVVVVDRYQFLERLDAAKVQGLTIARLKL
jgi:hypothetical protein